MDPPDDQSRVPTLGCPIGARVRHKAHNGPDVTEGGTATVMGFDPHDGSIEVEQDPDMPQADHLPRMYWPRKDTVLAAYQHPQIAAAVWAASEPLPQEQVVVLSPAVPPADQTVPGR